MILSDFLKAVRQLTDPAFLLVLALGLGLTIALLFGFYVVFVDGHRLVCTGCFEPALDRRDHLGR